MSTLCVPATQEALAPIATFVLEAAHAAGLDRRAAYRLRLAVDELATNIITYAYGGAGPGPITVNVELSARALTVILEDEGVAFDPRQVPAPTDLHLPLQERQVGGLGIYLALQGVDHFSYERVGDRNRNVLVVNRPPF
jgi:anti-sigma regulatory factor (Ser/Thr protein kinase)